MQRTFIGKSVPFKGNYILPPLKFSLCPLQLGSLCSGLNRRVMLLMLLTQLPRSTPEL